MPTCLGMVAVVTGGAQGIGKGIAIALLNEGAKVVIADIAKGAAYKFVDEAEDMVGEDLCHFIECDVRDSEALNKMLDDAKEWGGRLDIVVNSAGIFSKESKDAKSVLLSNLVHRVESTYKAIDLMSKQKGGKGGLVVNLSSISGLRIDKVSPFYTASESGIVAFTRSFGLWPYIEQDGVRVNCICPTSTDTEAVKSLFRRRPSSEDFVKREGMVGINDVVVAFMKIVNTGKMNAKVLSVTPPNHIEEA